MATHEDIVEQTLQDLLQAVKDLNPNQGSAQTSSSTSTATVTKKTNLELSKFSDGLVKTSKTIGSAVTSGITKPVGLAGKAVGSLGSVAVKTASSLNSFSKSLDTQAVKLFESSLTDSTAKITSFTNKFDVLPIFGSSLKSLGSITQSNIDVFRELTSVGADFGKGITEFRNSAAEAGLSVDDFRAVIRKNSETFALFAGNVSTGTQRFVEISKAIQKQYTPAFSKLGMTMSDLSEFTAGYIDQQTRLGRAQNMTVPQLVEGTQQYILELDQLSRVTGLSRKQLDEQQRKNMQDVRVKTLMASLDVKAQGEVRRTLTFLSALPAEYADTAAAVKEIIATGGIPISDFAKSLAATTPSVYKAAVALSNGSGSAAELTASLRQTAKETKVLDKATAQSANVLSYMNKNIGFGFKMSTIGLDRYIEGLDQATVDQKEALDSANNAVLAIDKTFQNLKDRIMSGTAPILEKFGSTLVRIVNTGMPYLDKFFKKLGEIYDKIAPKLDKMLERFGKIIMDSLPDLEKLFDNFLDMLGKTVPNILNTLLDFGTELPGKTKSIVGSLSSFLTDLAKHTPNISKWLSDMVTGLSETIPKVVKWFKELGSELEIRAPRLRQDILDLATSFDNNVPAIRKWIEELPGKLEEFSNVIIPAVVSGLKLFTQAVDTTYKFFNDENFRKQVLFSVIDGFSSILQTATPYVLAGLDKIKIALSEYWTFTVLPILQDTLYSLKNTLISYAASQWELMWDSLGEYLSETWLNFKKEHFSLFVTDDDLKEVSNRKDRNKEVRELHKKQLRDELEAAELKRKRERDADLQREKENKSRKTHIENQESFDQRVKDVNKSIADSLQSLKDTLGNIVPGTAPNVEMPSEMPLGAGDVEAPAGGVSANAQKALAFFKSHGFSDIEAASIVGNLMQERGPGLNPNAPANELGAYGIAQWLPKVRPGGGINKGGGRLDVLKKRHPKDWQTLEGQLQFILEELQAEESHAYKRFKETPENVVAKTTTWRKFYERPGKHEANDLKRIEYAKQLLSGKSVKGSSSPITAGSSMTASPDSLARAQESLKSRLSHSGIDVENLRADYAMQLSAFIEDAEKTFGRKIRINSAYRPPTRAEKAALKSRGTTQESLGKGKRVGSTYGSMHGMGIASDVRFADRSLDAMNYMSAADKKKWLEVAARHNLEFPMIPGGRAPGVTEWWHVEPRGEQRGGASRRGLAGNEYLKYIQSASLSTALKSGGRFNVPRGGTMLAAAKTPGGESTNISPTALQPVSGGTSGATTGISEMSSALLTATNNKLDQINTNMEKLLYFTEEANHIKEKILTATKKQKGNMLPTTV